MGTSLEKLITNLAYVNKGKDKEFSLKTAKTKFANIKNTYKLKNEEIIQKILRKGVYPYEYVDSFDKFNETSLPAKEHFYSTLTDSHISEEDYEHAKWIWEYRNMQN
jgi:hypothetical protein